MVGSMQLELVSSLNVLIPILLRDHEVTRAFFHTAKDHFSVLNRVIIHTSLQSNHKEFRHSC